MKKAAHIAGLLGLALFVALLVQFHGRDILRINALAGWRPLWLVPYRGLYFLLYAVGWWAMLRLSSPLSPRGQFAYVFWVTAVREAVDRLLPVASVGGAFVGIRLMGRRGFDRIDVSATIVAEIVLTLCAAYLFTVLGFFVALAERIDMLGGHHLWIVLLCMLPVPAGCVLLLRHGRMFIKLQCALTGLVGIDQLSAGALALDTALRKLMSHVSTLTTAGALQLAALVSGAVEVWFALRWFGHPIGLGYAVVLEAATQAVRHLAFFVPAALGIQEAGLIAFGQMLGVGPELALALSIVKRMREILCGVPCLLSWQWLEARRVRHQAAPAMPP